MAAFSSSFPYVININIMDERCLGRIQAYAGNLMRFLLVLFIISVKIRLDVTRDSKRL